MILFRILAIAVASASTSPTFTDLDYVAYDEESGVVPSLKEVMEDEEDVSRSRLDSTQSEDGLLLGLMDGVSTRPPSVLRGAPNPKQVRFGEIHRVVYDDTCESDPECRENVRFFCFLAALATMATFWGFFRAL